MAQRTVWQRDCSRFVGGTRVAWAQSQGWCGCWWRRYRAPECLLTDGYYNYKMDMWGVGCVFFEIVSLFPLFPGTNGMNHVPAPELCSGRIYLGVVFECSRADLCGVGRKDRAVQSARSDCLCTLLIRFGSHDTVYSRLAALILKTFVLTEVQSCLLNSHTVYIQQAVVYHGCARNICA